MSKHVRIGLCAVAFVLAAMPALTLPAAPGPNQVPGGGRDRGFDRNHHVLLISMDGMHAVD